MTDSIAWPKIHGFLVESMLVIAVLAGGIVPAAVAQAPRVLPRGEIPDDTRLGPLRGETGDFSFRPSRSPAEWKRRAETMRRILRVAMGLWPMPHRTPLEAVVHGKRDQGGYTVEKVYFQCVPGFYVTGNLYRPKERVGRRPAVLSPHGHFPGGRFQDEGRAAVRRQIVHGAERFEDGGRSFMQSRCVQLARMGCVVFHYDMVGYGDSVQIPLEVAHRFSRLRAEFPQPPAGGFYSAAAELWLQNPLGLHTYQSIRALDFLTSLPDVDASRIAVTGGSGGGTQTFMLCAVDPRPLVSVPVVIVSTTRQGGCTCENVSGLRIGTYNLGFTALHAPKPLLLISADDATRTMSERGFPELRTHYAMLGADQNVSHAALLQFPHNYNHVSRSAMYHWVNRHLDLGLEEPILEQPYRRLTRDELTVWDEKHPMPERGLHVETQILDWFKQDAERHLEALFPRDAQSLSRYQEIVGGAWDALIRHRASDFVAVASEPRDDDKAREEEADARPRPAEGTTFPVWFETRKSVDRGDYRQTLGLVRYRSVEDHTAAIPTIILAPRAIGRTTIGGKTVVWIDRQGKSGLFDGGGRPREFIRRLLDAGSTVIGVDLLGQGEFLADGTVARRQRWLPGETGFAGWTYCYNLPMFARRVHDILALVGMIHTGEAAGTQIQLVGLNGAGRWVAAAAAQARGTIACAAIDTGGFRFAGLSDIYDADFMPGAAKYGDIPGLLALAAPTSLWLAGEDDEGPPIVRAAFRSAGRIERLSVYSGEVAEAEHAAGQWLRHVAGNPGPEGRQSVAPSGRAGSVIGSIHTEARRAGSHAPPVKPNE